jgi:hypothetical protein
MGGETPVKALKHVSQCMCDARTPALFESDFIAFSCFKMAGCLSEEELEIAISLNSSFVAFSRHVRALY